MLASTHVMNILCLRSTIFFLFFFIFVFMRANINYINHTHTHTRSWLSYCAYANTKKKYVRVSFHMDVIATAWMISDVVSYTLNMCKNEDHCCDRNKKKKLLINQMLASISAMCPRTIVFKISFIFRLSFIVFARARSRSKYYTVEVQFLNELWLGFHFFLFRNWALRLISLCAVIAAHTGQRFTTYSRWCAKVLLPISRAPPHSLTNWMSNWKIFFLTNRKYF